MQFHNLEATPVHRPARFHDVLSTGEAKWHSVGGINGERVGRSISGGVIKRQDEQGGQVRSEQLNRGSAERIGESGGG